MGKRKLRTNPTPNSNYKKSIPNEERKEKLFPFDFNENDCDVAIITKDKEVHLPSSFLEMISNYENIKMADGKIEMDVLSEKLIKALSFYRPRDCEDTMKCKFLNFLSDSKSQ